jgi:hypothetical protein
MNAGSTRFLEWIQGDARAFARWSRVGAYDLPEAWVRRVAINLAALAAMLDHERSEVT